MPLTLQFDCAQMSHLCFVFIKNVVFVFRLWGMMGELVRTLEL